MFLLPKIRINESFKLNKILALATLSVTVLAEAAWAEETPEKFLETLNGEFRGRGEAVLEITNQQERVSCKLDNNFSSEEQILSITGVCATTQGKAEVEGKLSVVDGEVVGSFLSPFKNSEITKETSYFADGKLVLSTSFVNKDTGNLNRMRQIVVSNPEGGFNSTFQKFDNAAGDYKDTGYVEFSPTGN